MVTNTRNHLLKTILSFEWFSRLALSAAVAEIFDITQTKSIENQIW